MNDFFNGKMNQICFVNTEIFLFKIYILLQDAKNIIHPKYQYTFKSHPITAKPLTDPPSFKGRSFKSTLAVSDLCPRDDYNVSETLQGTDSCEKLGLTKLGISNIETIYHNLTFQELFDHEVANKEGEVAHAEYGDTFTVDTGKFTGRSPKDKWLVLNKGSESEANIDWNSINQATNPEVFDEIYEKAIKYYNTKEKAYIFDCYCGANPTTQKKVRFVHEMAWQQHFVTNMFIRPETNEEIQNFEPDFTIINACSQVDEDWKKHNLNSEVAAVFNIEKKIGVIFGTWYGGENKKGVFSLMNYWLPMSDPPQLPMHCSANVGANGDSALFFGLSGTGKTTLSADPKRALIGDDEHGWDEEGIYNFEGGCYAKTINLSENTEPDIYRAIRQDAMLENVKLNQVGDNLVPDYFDTSKTENGRVSYPIFHIDNYVSDRINEDIPSCYRYGTGIQHCETLFDNNLIIIINFENHIIECSFRFLI